MSEAAATEAQVSTKKKEAPVPAVRGMVAYADAGARPNPGFGGIGIHAYTYMTGVTLKGVGLGNIVASSQGYVSKDETTALVGLTTEEQVAQRLNKNNVYQVVPDQYIDYLRAVPASVTNNLCELMAVKKAVEMAIEQQARHLQIYSDSELTCKGVNTHMERWASNNWLRPDGTPLKNVETWKETKQIFDFARGTGMTVKLDWVRGHNGDTGNEVADQLATMSVFQSQLNRAGEREVRSPADGYWKMQIDRHPMVASPKLYFNTRTGATVPGEYYIGYHGKDDEQAGNRLSDAYFAVVRLAEPVEIIETMRQLQSQASMNSDRMYQLHLDRIFMPDHYRFLSAHKEFAIEQSKGYRLDLNFVDGPPLTREFKPAGIAHRIVDGVLLLDQVLQRFKDKDPLLQIVPLTDILYDKTVKVQKKKEIEAGLAPETEYTLKKEFGVGSTSFDITFPNPFYPDHEYVLTVTIGLDLLERNSLKRLEELSPEVNLIIWKDSEYVFRYATVIQAKGCEGIWAAPQANLRVVMPPGTQPAEDVKKAKKTKKETVETTTV